MYSTIVDRCWSLRLTAVFAKANATMPHANSIIHSSVDRRLAGASSGGWLPSAGEGIVMLLTRPPAGSWTRGPRTWRSGSWSAWRWTWSASASADGRGAACAVGSAEAVMPNAVAGAQFAASAAVGCGPGLALAGTLILALLLAAVASSRLVRGVLGLPRRERLPLLLALR